MSQLTGVPTYIWGLLLLPSVLIAVVGALRRTLVWAVMFCFSLAVVTVAATESYYTIFVMKRFDEKFRQAPGAAFELALFGDAIICLLGVLLLGGSLAFFARKKLGPKQSGLYVAPILGVFYTTLPNVLYWSRIDLPNEIFWIFVVAFPITIARLMVRKSGA
jgi:hypothetical protein